MLEQLTLEERRDHFLEANSGNKARIVICAGTGCVAGGALKIHAKFKEVLENRGLSVGLSLEHEKKEYALSESGCQGFCQQGPLVTIYPQGILYTKVRPDDVEEIVEKTILGGKTEDRLLYTLPATGERIAKIYDIPFYRKQRRLTLELCGNIDVNDLDEYISHGGYFMARKALFYMTDKKICKEITDSGLRGRGGGGFPTGRKWDLARIQPGKVKYIVCNGDEGDPGAFMDRCLMEGDPHGLIEGMLIAAQAIGAEDGYIYVRMEYPLAVRRLKQAILKATEAGFLGNDIFGSGKRFTLKVMEGAGAFVCGEETALIASIEGKRGTPVIKPPYPAERGLFGQPTVINNVETLVSVPLIMRIGAAEYAKLGTETAKGTKTFALTGHVANTGLIEVPFGATLREIVGEVGGGVVDDDGHLCGCEFKAVQIGGPSGGCLTQEHLDMPLDYDNLQKVGAMVGSGGLVVMNKNTCMVKIARFFMQFTQNESCGKCAVCREGTRQMLSLLDDIMDGSATEETLSLLEDLATTVKLGSLCGLGKTAPNPVLSTMKYFSDEYLAHVRDKRCPAGACEALLDYRIIPEKCKFCNLCAKKCPAEAISGAKGVPYLIDPEKCIKCGVCIPACKFQAIVKG